MASGCMLPFRPAVVVRAAVNTAENRKSDQIRRSTTSSFSPEPDYMNPPEEKAGKAAADGDPKTTRFTPGSFTAEKARQLRRMTNDASSFHDPMYHSAIASRLASDFSHRSAD